MGAGLGTAKERRTLAYHVDCGYDAEYHEAQRVHSSGNSGKPGASGVLSSPHTFKIQLLGPDVLK